MRLSTVLKMAMINRGHCISKIANEDAILKAIGLLKPIATGHDLVRIGGVGDGGYLVPDDLDGLNACFSPGVSTTANFEQELDDKYGIRSYLADFSVDKPPMLNKNFNFEKKFLGSVNDDVYIRLEDWIADKVGISSSNNLILQMDIEGSEFEVIIDTPLEVLRKFRIMVIEFHAMEMMFDPSSLRLLTGILQKLARNFSVAHVHPNNCKRCTVYRHRNIEIPSVFEVTFIRNDRIKPDDRKLEFPHPLDRKNVSTLAESILPKIWR